MLLSKVHKKGWTNAPQIHLAGEMFSRCTSESLPHVLVTSASKYMFLDQLSDFTVSQSLHEGLREQSDSLLVRKEKRMWSKGAKHRGFWLLTHP